MTETNPYQLTEGQILRNRMLLSDTLENAERIIDIASEEAFVAEFFGMSTSEFNLLWYEIIALRGKLDGTIPVIDNSPEKDVSKK